MAGEDSVSFEPKNAQDLKHFLEANKEKYHEIWIIIEKKSRIDLQPLTFKDAVSLAIAQGLVDNRKKTLDEKHYAIRFTKRKVKNSAV